MSRPTVFQMVFFHTIVPLVLMTVVPVVLLCIPHLVVNHESRLSALVAGDPVLFVQDAVKQVNLVDVEVWSAVFGLGAWAAASILFLGGERYHGPPTINGFKPEYRNNGFRYYLLTMAISALGFYFDVIPAWYCYQKLVTFIGYMMLLGFTICIVLFIKGHLNPSPGEHGSHGNPIFDFYWGLELYPRFGRWFDVKMWTNCRVGLMMWQLIVLIAWKAQIEYNGSWNYAMSASAILQTVYIAKFFWWEDGYMKSIDIFVDRAGYYICFGCLSYIPVVYAITSLYLVENSPLISRELFVLFVSLGVLMVALNYWSDYQRQVCRATNGKCTLWGKRAKVIHATYTDSKGDKKKSVLLASGFWQFSRHFNYVFEIMAAFFWEVPALCTSVVPYFYLIHLVILLVHRSYRDDKKCSEKYGRHWDEYCKISKYRILPYVF